MTISEENIDSSIIEVLQPTNNFPTVMSIALNTGDRNIYSLDVVGSVRDATRLEVVPVSSDR